MTDKMKKAVRKLVRKPAVPRPDRLYPNQKWEAKKLISQQVIYASS